MYKEYLEVTDCTLYLRTLCALETFHLCICLLSSQNSEDYIVFFLSVFCYSFSLKSYYFFSELHTCTIETQLPKVTKFCSLFTVTFFLQLCSLLHYRWLLFLSLCTCVPILLPLRLFFFFISLSNSCVQVFLNEIRSLLFVLYNLFPWRF